MKYYLIAGEASGDLHGSNLMHAIKQQDAEADFRFFGGDLMQAEGGQLSKHYQAMAFMGFVEVVFNLRQIFANIKHCKIDILDYQPDVLVLIDFPGFNLRIAEFAKEQGIKVVYYISPKVWAWNTKRVEKIKRVVDKLLLILPFEVDFYRSYHYEAEYVGNPLMDAISAHRVNAAFRQDNLLSDQPILALLPGSRKQEIERILPVMLAAANEFKGYQIVVAGAPSFPPNFYTPYLQHNEVLVVNQTYDLLSYAAGAMVTSGTATLETALFEVPQVVCYKGHPLTIAIGRMLIKLRFISLVNLIMDKVVVKELIQNDCSAENIKQHLTRILPGGRAHHQLMEDYKVLAEKVGTAGASARAAGSIIHFIKS